MTVERITPAQRRLLNAVCACLADQIVWHGRRMSKDSWRHFVAAVILRQDMVPGFDLGNGDRGFVVLERSSMELSKAQAEQAITELVAFGDNPANQAQAQPAVVWSDAVLLGLGFNPNDMKDSA